MSTTIVERDLGLDRGTRSSPPRRVAHPGRPARGSARSFRPQARPAGVVDPPTFRRARSAGHRSCTVALPPAPMATWRLTDRGIAAVLVVAAMIALTGLSVLGLTAWRVTSERFQPTSQAGQAVAPAVSEAARVP